MPELGHEHDPPPPGATVEYIAAELPPRPNASTIEGMIAGVGQLASSARQHGGSAPRAGHARLFVGILLGVTLGAVFLDVLRILFR